MTTPLPLIEGEVNCSSHSPQSAIKQMFPSPAKWFNALFKGAVICSEASYCLKRAVTQCSPGFPPQQFALMILRYGVMSGAMIDGHYEEWADSVFLLLRSILKAPQKTCLEWQVSMLRGTEPWLGWKYDSAIAKGALNIMIGHLYHHSEYISLHKFFLCINIILQI